VQAFVSTCEFGLTVKEEVDNPYHERRPTDEPARVKPVGLWRTPSVRSNPWQHVKMDFQISPWPRMVVLGFAAVGNGTAYFDDFSLVRLDP
jgi:hypothetical protein